MNNGIIKAIELLGKANEGNTDYETYLMVGKIIRAMENKDRQEWPNKELRTLVNKLEKTQRGYFLDVMKDMQTAFVEELGYEPCL